MTARSHTRHRRKVQRRQRLGALVARRRNVIRQRRAGRIDEHQEAQELARIEARP